MVGTTRRRALIAMGAARGFAALPAALRAVEPAPNLSDDDADLAIRLLERYHPGLLRYLNAAGWVGAAEQFRADYAAGSLSGKYLALSRLTAAIRCSHSHVNPYNLDDAVADELWARRACCPSISPGWASG